MQEMWCSAGCSFRLQKPDGSLRSDLEHEVVAGQEMWWSAGCSGRGGRAWTRQASGERGSTTNTRGSSGLSRSAGRMMSPPDRRSYSSSEAAPADDDCGGTAGFPLPDYELAQGRVVVGVVSFHEAEVKSRL